MQVQSLARVRKFKGTHHQIDALEEKYKVLIVLESFFFCSLNSKIYYIIKMVKQVM